MPFSDGSVLAAAELLERLSPGRDAELREQALHVGANRVLGDEQALRDLVSAEMPVEEEQHLELARRHGARDRVRDDRSRTALPYLVEQAPCDRSLKRGLAL